MDKQNKKLNKHSIKNLKNDKKSFKKKDSLIGSVRTPRQKNLKINFKKIAVQKLKSFKSIPTITYRQGETTQYASEIYQNYSYLNQTLYKNNQQADQYSIKNLQSQRRPIKSSSIQISKPLFPINKLRKQSKIKKLIKQKTKTIRNQQNMSLTILFKRTNTILDRYKKLETQWKKEKAQLVKELEKCKNKLAGKSIISTASSYNSHSHKLLI